MSSFYTDYRVFSIDDERESGNSIIVTLEYGFRFTHGDVMHVAGFDNYDEIHTALKTATRCECEECEMNR